jgi:hypothetical protein
MAFNATYWRNFNASFAHPENISRENAADISAVWRQLKKTLAKLKKDKTYTVAKELYDKARNDLEAAKQDRIIAHRAWEHAEIELGRYNLTGENVKGNEALVKYRNNRKKVYQRKLAIEEGAQENMERVHRYLESVALASPAFIAYNEAGKNWLELDKIFTGLENISELPPLILPNANNATEFYTPTGKNSENRGFAPEPAPVGSGAGTRGGMRRHRTKSRAKKEKMARKAQKTRKSRTYVR